MDTLTWVSEYEGHQHRKFEKVTYKITMVLRKMSRLTWFLTRNALTILSKLFILHCVFMKLIPYLSSFSHIGLFSVLSFLLPNKLNLEKNGF